jgi:hypothetical protein
MYKNALTRGVENESLAWIDAGKKASAASRFLPRRGRPFFRKIMARSGRARRGRGILIFSMIFSPPRAWWCGF